MDWKLEGEVDKVFDLDLEILRMRYKKILHPLDHLVQSPERTCLRRWCLM